MAKYNKPTLIDKVWASGGDKVAPDSTKYEVGWLPEIPPRQWFNFLQNKVDLWVAYSNQMGIPEWDSTTEYQANKSFVQGSDGNIYQALQTDTNRDPVGDNGSRWRRVAVEDAPSNGTSYLRKNGAWSQLDASAFAPASHIHPISDITNLASELSSKVSRTAPVQSILAAGQNMALGLHNSVGNSNFMQGIQNGIRTWYIGQMSAGSNDVTVGAFNIGTSITFQSDRFVSTKEGYVGGNKLWHMGDFAPQDFAPASHTHTIAQVTNLQTELDRRLKVDTPNQSIMVGDNVATLGLYTQSNTKPTFYQGIRTGGVRSWWVGEFVEGSTTVTLGSTRTGTILSLLSDRIQSNKEVYYNSLKYWHQGDFQPNQFAAANHTHDYNTLSNKPAQTEFFFGTVSNGGTIPLPAGYSRGQCKYFVGLNNVNVNNGTWDIEEKELMIHLRTECTVNQNTGVVTATMTVYDTGIRGYKTLPASANYVVFATK